MGEYGNVKRRKLVKFLNWLQANKKVEIIEGANHTLLKCIHNGEKTPTPIRHNKVDKNLVFALQKWLERNQICSKEEFDEHIK